MKKLNLSSLFFIMQSSSRNKARAANLVYRHKKYEDDRASDKPQIPKPAKILADGTRVWSFGR